MSLTVTRPDRHRGEVAALPVDPYSGTVTMVRARGENLWHMVDASGGHAGFTLGGYAVNPMCDRTQVLDGDVIIDGPAGVWAARPNLCRHESCRERWKLIDNAVTSLRRYHNANNHLAGPDVDAGVLVEQLAMVRRPMHLLHSNRFVDGTKLRELRHRIGAGFEQRLDAARAVDPELGARVFVSRLGLDDELVGDVTNVERYKLERAFASTLPGQPAHLIAALIHEGCAPAVAVKLAEAARADCARAANDTTSDTTWVVWSTATNNALLSGYAHRYDHPGVVAAVPWIVANELRDNERTTVVGTVDPDRFGAAIDLYVELASQRRISGSFHHDLWATAQRLS